MVMRRGLLVRLAASAAVIGGAGALAGAGTFSAFSSTTSNAGNSFAAGTVTIGDNDAGAAMYSLTGAKPGDSVSRCIRVAYGGTLASDVRLYTASTIGALGPYVNLTITAGSQASPSFPSCSGFTPDAGGALFSGTLADFAGTHSGWANGLGDSPEGDTKWESGDAVVYRFTLTLADDNAANGGDGGAVTTGSHAFTWEARNQ